jgi:endogenous inhibitor of DNA gyrase (YacG/DUF329 family)
MSFVICPTCGKQFEVAESRAMPFCSDRCKQIDLGRWLSEGISMPLSELGEDAPPPPRDAEAN